MSRSPAPEAQSETDRELAAFWARHLAAAASAPPTRLPPSRIKRVMRTDDDVRPLAISSEAPAVLARAAEVFVEEMALRSWLHAKAMKRGVVLKEDVSAGARHEMFDFLIDILPRETDFLAKNEEPQPEAHVRAADYYQQYARERAIEADEAEAAAGGNEG